MKKRLIPILVCLVLSLACLLSGCGDSFGKIKVEGKQDYDYVVHSQGGMAVQYGNYVYFINGYGGYEDTDANQNLWPNVVKGGLYRAELYTDPADKTTGKVGNEFVTSQNPSAVATGLEFVVDGTATDYAGNRVDNVAVQSIAPKRIGTSGYKDGGIFIYDEWVYFATPNNEKNKSGNVQYSKTDFFRARLDGSEVKKIYTTESDSADAPYAFYKYGGSVYLVAQDGTDLVSVKIDKKIGKKVTIAQNVTKVILPYSDTYYAGMNENTLDHFVYVLRAVTDEDYQKTGNVIEIMRPDGKQGAVYHSQGNTSDSLEAVRDGMLFFRTTNASGKTIIRYDNLHDFFMNDSYGDSGYKAYQNKLAGYLDESGAFKENVTDEQKAEYYANARKQIGGKIDTLSISDYTETYCFRPGGESSEVVRMIGVTSDKIEMWTSGGTTITLYNAGVTFVAVEGEYMYFTADDILCRTPWHTDVADKGAAQAISKEAISTSAVFNFDYCAGNVAFMADVDTFATSYTFFKAVDNSVGNDPVFVGKKITNDMLTAPKITLKKGVISWDAVPNAASYTIYCMSDGTVEKISTGLTATQYTLEDAGQYWVVAVAGDEDIVSPNSNTVNYKG